MQSQQSAINYGGLFWDQKLLPPELFEERLKRIQEAMAERKDDAWLIYGDAQRSGNLAFLTYEAPHIRPALGFVPRTGAITVLPRTSHVAVAALIGAHGLRSAKIGTVDIETSMPFGEWSAIRTALPDVHWESRDEAFRALRPPRHLADRNGPRGAGRAVERGLMVARHILRAGISIRHVTALIEREMRREAADDVRILVAAGPQTGEQLRPPDDRELGERDVVMLFVAAEVQRYWAEAAQTLVLGGSGSPALKELVNKASRAVLAMEHVARAGTPVSAVATAARGVLGTGALWESAGAYGLGHGIGLDTYEPPTIALDSAENLGLEQTLALHVVLHEGTLGAVAGNTVLIRGKETSQLSSHPPLIEDVPH
jgi:Xaa-Pro aminopeptidase